MREDAEVRLLHVIEEHNELLEHPDQDALNIVFHRQIFPLPVEWNYHFQFELGKNGLEEACAGTEFAGVSNIHATCSWKLFHMIGSKKPWLFPEKSEEYIVSASVWWKPAMETASLRPHLSQLLEEFTQWTRRQLRHNQWHRSHGTSPLWDALCWTWRDGDAPQHYAPILADRRMPVRDLALFVHKIAHTDRLETADKTAILSNLFESYSAHDKHGSTIWTDTTIGAMVRRLMPGTDDPTRLAERLATDMSVSEWIWGIARDLPDLRQGAAHDAYGAPPRAIDARPDDYQAFRARREEQLGQWREQPEHAEAARADQTDAERLEHVADLLERVQPTPLETEQIKAPLGAPWIPARDVHDFMMETFNVRGHGLTPGKLSQYSVETLMEDRKSTRLNSSHSAKSRMPSSA